MREQITPRHENGDQLTERHLEETNIAGKLIKRELGHGDLFDDAGHLTHLGVVAARIANGLSVEEGSDHSKGRALDLLDQERIGSRQIGYDIVGDRASAGAEDPYRRHESTNRRAAELLDEPGTRRDAINRVRVSQGKQPIDDEGLIPSDEIHPKYGTKQDVNLAATLPRAVLEAANKQNKEGVEPSQEESRATQQALREAIEHGPGRFVAWIKGLLGKEQLSRTDSVKRNLQETAHTEGVLAQEAGEAVRVERQKATEAEKNQDGSLER